ncbi:hypothetical protein V494_00545 [Pseudogymnoascus sp. VKM F-4513 (FW-928)]|nr:hypothetical protein V494_00545 [Pseudogymnoascus sp. VKM F-4513 (FW-928)]
MVLNHHASTMADLSQICAYAKAGKQTATPESVDKKTVAPHGVIENHLWRVKRMDQLAEKTYLSLNHLVDLKHKHASILEASSARKQAENTLLQAQNTSRQADYAARQAASTAEQTTASVKQATATAQQGKTILMFTVVTIIFLPLSFMAAFFAIAIDSFPVNEKGKLAMSYVLKYMLSVSGAACIPFILVAFQQDRIIVLLTWVRENISDGFSGDLRMRRPRKYSNSSSATVNTDDSRYSRH